jgi:hypothetical protein
MISLLLSAVWRKALLVGSVAVVVASILLGARRAGRLAERAEVAVRNEEIRRAQLQAAARRPHDRAALSDRLRAGTF